MAARLCRECGCEIRAESIVHGRSSVRSLWWVHTATGKVPCPPHRRAEHRARTSDPSHNESFGPGAGPEDLRG